MRLSFALLYFFVCETVLALYFDLYIYIYIYIYKDLILRSSGYSILCRILIDVKAPS